jgi:hypothetical protein
MSEMQAAPKRKKPTRYPWCISYPINNAMKESLDRLSPPFANQSAVLRALLDTALKVADPKYRGGA